MGLPTFTNPVRVDHAGDGHFGKPRGGHTHTGEDALCIVGATVRSGVAGKVTKLGFCYGSGPGAWDAPRPYRYVEVTCVEGLKHRYLYVEPSVDIGARITVGVPIGVAQDVAARYPDSGMLAHVHYEVFEGDKQYLDPRQF